MEAICWPRLRPSLGIMTLFVCGIVMGRYTWHNLGDYSKLSTPQTFKSFAVIADAYVFLYLGLSVFGFSDIHQWKVGFISVALLLCLVARFLNIVPLTLLVNLWRKEKFNWRETVMLWFTGLRGAIAFALAIHTVGVTPNGNEILTTTLAIVMISVWVIGGLSFPMLRLLKLEPPQEEHHNQSNVASSILLVNKGPNIVHDQLSENGDINEQVVLGHPKVDTWMKRINKRFLVPFFRRAEDRDKTLRDSLFAGTIADDMVVMEANQTEFSEIKVVIDSKVGENRSRLRIEEYVDETQNDSTIDVELDQE
ncbi:sodium/hydrogen exchanger [Acrasis kona]|uniref:Sodium/hydrogen exchanger n=1 Tax=Acrasis kona TaxID=1008807 RepID=A0AAW2YZG6_9EUKA